MNYLVSGGGGRNHIKKKNNLMKLFFLIEPTGDRRGRIAGNSGKKTL